MKLPNLKPHFSTRAKKSARHAKFLAPCLVYPCRDYLLEASLGTPKILSSGATLHLGPIRLHVENWKCDAIKSSAQCQKFGATCRFFSACKWSLTRRHMPDIKLFVSLITIVLNNFQRINTNHCPSLEY